ncbi:MAG: orotidine-5'-phosphate decarboxylase [Candidatus Levyibacteriota bacterium]
MTQLHEQAPRPADSQFREVLRQQWSKGLFVSVGLDSDVAVIGGSQYEFNCETIDAVADIAGAFKPNIAFYEDQGPQGLEVLRKTMEYLDAKYPDVPTILDYKRGDIGNTNLGYVRLAFDVMKADAVTVSPYLGQEALQPFLDNKDKGIFVLDRTSNSGAGEFQDLPIALPAFTDEYIERYGSIDELKYLVGLDSPLFYQVVAYRVSRYWNGNDNCGLVTGATYPREISEIRKISPTLPLLIPGVGAQEGDLEGAVLAGIDATKQGILVNSSRGVIFAVKGSGHEEAARMEVERLNKQINAARQKAA